MRLTPDHITQATEKKRHSNGQLSIILAQSVEISLEAKLIARAHGIHIIKSQHLPMAGYDDSVMYVTEYVPQEYIDPDDNYDELERTCPERLLDGALTANGDNNHQATAAQDAERPIYNV